MLQIFFNINLEQFLKFVFIALFYYSECAHNLI